MKIPLIYKNAKQPHCSQLQNDTAPTNKRSFICFSSISRVTMGTLQLVVFPGSERREGKKKKKEPPVYTIVSNFRLEGSYIFKTILLTKLITEKMLNEM